MRGQKHTHELVVNGKTEQGCFGSMLTGISNVGFGISISVLFIKIKERIG